MHHPAFCVNLCPAKSFSLGTNHRAGLDSRFAEDDARATASRFRWSWIVVNTRIVGAVLPHCERESNHLLWQICRYCSYSLALGLLSAPAAALALSTMENYIADLPWWIIHVGKFCKSKPILILFGCSW